VRRGNQLVVIGEDDCDKARAVGGAERLICRLKADAASEPADVTSLLRMGDPRQGTAYVRAIRSRCIQSGGVEIQTRKKRGRTRTAAQRLCASLFDNELAFWHRGPPHGHKPICRGGGKCDVHWRPC